MDELRDPRPDVDDRVDAWMLPTRLLADRPPRHARHTPSWGRLEVQSPPRWGWSAYRLRVYPPSIDATGRLLVWFDDWAPLLGALGGVAAFAANSSILAPAWLLAFIPAGLLATTFVARRLSADVRSGIRSLEVSYAQVDDRVRAYGDRACLEHAVTDLCAMDHALADGSIDANEYLRRWTAVYDLLPRHR